MSNNFSNYHSEVVGFDSVNADLSQNTSSGTQTTEFKEINASSQTNITQECGTSAVPEELTSSDVLGAYPSGLNEFLKRVVPGMLQELDQNKELLYNSSDSDEEDAILPKLVEEIITCDIQGGGDQQLSILDLTFSSGGNSLAVSIGISQHADWCTHTGLIKIYTAKYSAGDKFNHSMDINEKNCVSVVEYHPSIAALLGYGTVFGEIVVRNLSSVEQVQLTSPSGCHGCKRVSHLQWAESPLANIFLTMQVKGKGTRRRASDQILISSGSDGTMNIWQVNANTNIFENVVSYVINGSGNIASDITCFDFIRNTPLRPCEEKMSDDLFVAGTNSGSLLVCKVKDGKRVVEGDSYDPVFEALDGHSTCVLTLAFSFQRPEIFHSVSIDSELRVYDVKQMCLLKVFNLDVPVTCMRWVPHSPCVAVAGVSGVSGPIRLYNSRTGLALRLDGFTGDKDKFVTALVISQTGSCRVAAGDSEGAVRVWDLPLRPISYTADELDL